MAAYMRLLGGLLVLLGLAGTALCAYGLVNDEAYYDALKGLSKYPSNVLYQTELKMAEPRHLLLTAGAYGAVTSGIVLGSICISLGALLAREPTR
jgi:hypothetical protein